MKTPSYTKTPVTLLRKVNLLAIASISLFATSISFAHPFENDADEETVRILANGNLTKVEQGADVNLAVEVQTVRGKELRSPLNGAKTQEIRDYLIANGAQS